jgi:hypothetical protein
MARPDRPTPGSEERRRLLPASSSLAVLLIVFLTLSLLTLFSIMRGGTGEVASDAGGTKAYGPADFPEIEFDRELLPEVREAGPSDEAGTFRVRLPLAYEDYYPCSDCHADMEVNLERRELEEMHDDIHLNHGPEERWCFDCHNPDDRTAPSTAIGGRGSTAGARATGTGRRATSSVPTATTRTRRTTSRSSRCRHRCGRSSWRHHSTRSATRGR